MSHSVEFHLQVQRLFNGSLLAMLTGTSRECHWLGRSR